MQAIPETAAVSGGFAAVETRPRNVEVLLFLVCNGAAAAINVGSRILLSAFLPYSVAIVIAYLIGMLVAFALSRSIVFRAREGRVGTQAVWFALVNLASVLQTLGVSLLFARVVLPALGVSWHPETVAHGIGVVVPAVSSYFGHKHLSFRRAGPGTTGVA